MVAAELVVVIVVAREVGVQFGIARLQGTFVSRRGTHVQVHAIEQVRVLAVEGRWGAKLVTQRRVGAIGVGFRHREGLHVEAPHSKEVVHVNRTVFLGRNQVPNGVLRHFAVLRLVGHGVAHVEQGEFLAAGPGFVALEERRQFTGLPTECVEDRKVQVHQRRINSNVDVAKHVLFGVQNDTQAHDLTHETKVHSLWSSFAPALFQKIKHMLTRLLKILLAAASIAYTVMLYTQGSWGAAIGMTLLSVVLVLVNLRSVRLVVAFANLRMQRMEEAVKWLGRIKPNQLWPGQRGYYHFLLGSVTMQSNLVEAESHLRKSLSLGLRQEHDKAAVKLNLAVCLSAKQDRKKALVLIQEAKRLDTKGMLKGDIKQVEAMIKNPRVVQRARR